MISKLAEALRKGSQQKRERKKDNQNFSVGRKYQIAVYGSTQNACISTTQTIKRIECHTE